MLRHLLAATALSAAITTGASAATVYFNDFSGEGGGNNVLNIGALAGLTVSGQVDLVQAVNPFGIAVSSAVIDLDGTSGPGALLSSGSFNVLAGQTMTLTFVVGGAQRGSTSDSFSFGVMAAGGATFNSAAFGYADGAPLAGNAPFLASGAVYTFLSGGQISFSVGTGSGDNIGPLLDSITVDISNAVAVPEPATGLLLAGSFGLLVLARRRRG
jgi:hypothetical protein